MRLCVVMFLLPFALLSQTVAPTPRTPAPKPEDLGSISGKLLNGATGEPVRSATLSLQSGQQSYSATTDAAGKFALTDIQPGRYRVTADRTGFGKPVYVGRVLTGPASTLELRGGQPLNDLSLRVMPHGVVTGRVTGLGGDPISGALVVVLALSYSRDGKGLSFAGNASTNDLGEYRIYGLTQGKYYVAATERLWAPAPSNVNRPMPVKAEEQYVQTYFPGVFEASAAVLVEVLPGGEARNIDIRMTRRRTVSLRGRVIRRDLPDGINPSTVILAPHLTRGLGDPLANRNAIFDAKGNFEFTRVSPGSYDLMAMTGQGGKTYSNRIQVEVGEDPIDNLTLTISPGFTVTGSVRLEKDGDRLSGNPHILLMRRDLNLPHGQPIDVAVGTDGTFAIPNVSPDRYDVQLTGIQANCYLKAIRAGERDVQRLGLDALSGVTPSLDIVLGLGSGEVSGVVQDADSKLVSNALVVLVPREVERRDSLANYRRSTATQDGAFRLRGLPPGEYKIFAWEIIEDFAYLDPEFLKPLESKGKPITIGEGSRQVVQLRSIE